jgi:hypothetical protein
MTTTVELRCKHWLYLLPNQMYIPSLQGMLSVLRTLDPRQTTESWDPCRLTLMSYYGVVLLLAGYQADETHILKRYRAIVEKVAGRFPLGSLWILNRVMLSSGCFLVMLTSLQAKILRMSYDADGAIQVLRDGLKMERSNRFKQADSLVIFLLHSPSLEL